jgi:hypothetical protein
VRLASVWSLAPRIAISTMSPNILARYASIPRRIPKAARYCTKRGKCRTRASFGCLCEAFAKEEILCDLQRRLSSTTHYQRENSRREGDRKSLEYPRAPICPASGMLQILPREKQTLSQGGSSRGNVKWVSVSSSFQRTALRLLGRTWLVRLTQFKNRHTGRIGRIARRSRAHSHRGRFDVSLEIGPRKREEPSTGNTPEERSDDETESIHSGADRTRPQSTQLRPWCWKFVSVKSGNRPS